MYKAALLACLPIAGVLTAAVASGNPTMNIILHDIGNTGVNPIYYCNPSEPSSRSGQPLMGQILAYNGSILAWTQTDDTSGATHSAVSSNNTVWRHRAIIATDDGSGGPAWGSNLKAGPLTSSWTATSTTDTLTTLGTRIPKRYFECSGFASTFSLNATSWGS
jgi:hypothetical protein